MTRLKFLFVVGMLLSVRGAVAQPRDLVLPRTGDRRESTKPPQAGDPLANYANNRREAALAAFQAGFKAATLEHNRDRATRLMLVALRRDPSLDVALYDIGILCAQYARWEDAINFQKEARQRALPGSEVAKLAGAELERVEAVALLETSLEGAKRREYDRQFWAASVNADPIKALIAVTTLTQRDAARWEGFALAGILQAETGAYSESLKAFETAMRIAPAARRTELQASAEIASREVSFTRLVQQGDGCWEQRRYDDAAKAYGDAWESSPGRLNIGMRAVTAYLLADQVAPAVQVLSRLRNSGQPDLDTKITAMLRELGPISEQAKVAAARPAGGPAPLPGDPADRIRKQIGSLGTPQMELAAKSDPALLDGTKAVIPVPDPEIDSGQSNGFLSTVSLFALYQRGAALGGPANPPPDPAMQAAPQPPAPPAVASPAGRVDVISQPAGAAITFDKDDPNLTPRTCIAPCEVALTPGRHTLRATLSGYRGAARIVEVERDRQTVIVELDAKRGSIWVDSNPVGLALSLNGKSTGKVTPARLLLDEGEYDLSVEIGGNPVIQKVSIQDGSLNRTHFGQ